MCVVCVCACVCVCVCVVCVVCVCVVCVCCVCVLCVCVLCVCVHLLCYGIHVATFTIGWKAMCGIHVHVKQDVPRSDRRARPAVRAF